MKTNYYPNRQLEPISATAAIATGVAGLLGTGANIAAQSSMNKKTRLWNEKMYALQRQHSLQDWTMQNEYNSPQAQMQRLKMAGLNPNLVYGKGADNVSGMVRSAEPKSWNPQAPNFNLGQIAGDVFSQYYNTEMKNAQTNNLRATNTVLINEALLKAAQTADVLQNTKGKTFDLAFKEEFRKYHADLLKEGVRQLQIETDLKLNRDQREAAQNSASVTEAVQRILNFELNRAKTTQEINLIKAQINNLGKDAHLKELDTNLKEQGLQPGDPMILRMAAQKIEEIKKAVGAGWDKMKKLFK